VGKCEYAGCLLTEAPEKFLIEVGAPVKRGGHSKWKGLKEALVYWRPDFQIEMALTEWIFAASAGPEYQGLLVNEVSEWRLLKALVQVRSSAKRMNTFGGDLFVKTCRFYCPELVAQAGLVL
jgi:hypothetical protein